MKTTDSAFTGELRKIEVDKVTKDYMKIEYAGGSSLYVPATQLDVIQKYADSDAAKAPKLNRLGDAGVEPYKDAGAHGSACDRRRSGKAVCGACSGKKAFTYSEDTVWQREFEEMFPFDETDDQLTAIEAVPKRTWRAGRSWTASICGDVGYGKTEIAIRAAFKAVQDGKQVVYLVPTTILAQQHYNTFVQRMKDFPVRVDLMCRFRTPAEQKKTID